jgi:hypothetical protein
MGLVTLAVSAAVERNDPVVRGQIREDACLDPPCVKTSRESVDEDHRRARSLVDIADTHAVRVEKLVVRRHTRACDAVERQEPQEDHRQSEVPSHQLSPLPCL